MSNTTRRLKTNRKPNVRPKFVISERLEPRCLFSTPTITAISPPTGTVAGGTSVTITGTSFTGATAVLFGSVPAESYTVSSATSIIAVSPAESAGTVNVSVQEGGSTSPTVSVDEYTFAPVPTVAGPGTSTSPGPTVGSTTPTFTWTPVTPTTGVTGYQLNLYDNTLKQFTSYQISGVSSSSFTIPSSAPLNPGDSYVWNLRVVTSSGTTGPESAYLYFVTPVSASAPQITNVSPASGSTAGGTQVTITGTNFASITSVRFGSVAASSFTVNSPTSITATSPAESAALVNITVSGTNGTSSIVTVDQFTFVAPSLPVPTVAGPGTTTSPGPTVGSTTPTFTWTPVTPTAGVTGYQLNLYDNTLKQFTSYQISGVSSSSFTIPGSAPLNPGDSYVWNLRVVTSSGTTGPESAYLYFVTPVSASAPQITNVSPASGSTAGGTQVTITGTNFASITSVRFGSVAASSFTVNSPTSITATSPAESAALVNITVSGTNGTSSIVTVDQFTFVAPSLPVPTVAGPGTTTSPGPTVGSTTPTFTWTPVTPTTGVTGYQLNLYDNTLKQFTSYQISGVSSDSFTIPSSAPLNPGDSYVWNLRVVTSSGTTGPESAYLYFLTPVSASAPQITNVSPASGSTAGGTQVTITGTNFSNVSSVRFGSVAASSFTVNSPTSITATSPAESAALVNITVSGTNGSSSIVTADQFTFVAPSLPVPTVAGPGTTTSPGPTVGSTTPTFTWTPVTPTTGVTGYQLNLYDNTLKQFTSYQISGVSSSSFTIPSSAPLNPGDSYVWNLRVVTSSGTTGPESAYLYFVTPVSASAPQITNVSPASGSTAGGTQVTITGTNFASITSVRFGSVAASSFTVNSPTSITATSPAESVGKVNITVSGSDGTSALVSADDFSYSATALPVPSVAGPGTTATPGPVITSLTPTFTWTPVAATAGVTGYQLNLYDNTLKQFTSYQISGVSSSSFTIPSSTPLNPGDSYVWNLRVVTSSGTTGPESAYLNFQTQASTSSTTVTSTPTASLTPALSGPVTTSTLTSSTINLHQTVTLTNVTSNTVKGSTTTTLYLSTSPTLDASAIPLLTTTKNVKVKTGKHASISLALKKLPAYVGNGTYYLITQTTEPSGAVTSVASTQTITVNRG